MRRRHCGRTGWPDSAGRPQPPGLQVEENAMSVGKLFADISSRAAHAAGKPWAFMLAVLSIIVWLVCGPFYGFSDTWQLIINTGTTIVTFLMVFLIQNSQNR